MSIMRVSLGLVMLAAAPLAACSESTPPGPPGEPTPIGSILADHLGSVIDAPGDVAPLGYRLSQLAQVEPSIEITDENCEGPVANGLWAACDEIQRSGLAYSCGAQANFFYAHDTPRCGVRVVLWDDDSFTGMPEVIAFDLSGTPVIGWGLQCGNGNIEELEECDDGNHDDWDGCDANCNVEEFTGCETVIEHYFGLAEIAHVDATAWNEPRSHMMVHPGATALRPVDASLCNAAAGTAQDVCNELQSTMGFVSYCSPIVELENGACNVRLEVSFSRVSPEDAVFTTRLTGILAFTIQ